MKSVGRARGFERLRAARSLKRARLVPLRILFVALLVFAGCANDDGERGEGEVYRLHVISSEPLDELVWYIGLTCHENCEAPLTPSQLAAGDTTSALTLWRGGRIEKVFETPQHTAEISGFTLSSFRGPMRFLVLGYQRDASGARVLVSSAMITVDVPSNSVYEKDLHLKAPPADIELWGVKTCAAVGNDYFTATPFDDDCDGSVTADDCNDHAHCDPTSPNLATCGVRSCEPCVGDVLGTCALGTQRVCRDGSDYHRTYTCEVSAACGLASTCLPASACEVGCDELASGQTPLACVRDAWRMDPAGALVCRFPSTAGGDDCAGRTAIDIPLPYASCAGASLLSWVPWGAELLEVTITPGCTLHVERQGDPTKITLSPREVLVAFVADGSAHSVRLQLVGTSAGCTTAGSCDPAPATALCQ